MASWEMKLKTLIVMKVLQDDSDEEHPVTAADIDRKLQGYGMYADRRSIYGDIQALEQFGMDIVKAPGNRGWYLAERELELPELKILIDAVQVAKFISPKKSEALIRKLEGFAGRHQARKLHRQIFLSNPAKTGFEKVYYIVDLLYEAMSENFRISFQYAEWTEKKEQRLRHGGKVYTVSPWGLIWDDENYYLLAYDPEIQDIKHYRVDRMMNAQVLPHMEREGAAVYEQYQKNFSGKTFGMFGGEEVNVTLKCANRTAGVIIDRYGLDVMMVPKRNGYFTVHFSVNISPQFFGWIAANGTDMEILEPAGIRRQYKDFLAAALELYL